MHPHPLFEVFGIGVYPYGVFIGIGLLACIIVLYLYTTKKGMPTYVQDFVFASAIVGIGLGFGAAALWQAFFNYLASGEFEFGGITVMGGLVGGAIAFVATYFIGGHFLFKKERKGIHIKEFNKVVRVAPICICIAHAFGRLGCLMAGCCHGKFLSDEFVVGGIARYHYSEALDKVTLLGYYVPTQLYEALFLFALFGILSLLYFKGSNFTMHIYLIAYGIWRMFIEFLRDDYRGGVAESIFTPSQWMSIAFITAGIALFIIYEALNLPMFLKEKRYTKKNGEVQEVDKK